VIADGASPLQQALFDAIEARDADAFNSLAQRYRDAIEAEFPSWLKVPESIRADPQAANRYVHTIFTIAQAFANAGVPSLLEQLTPRDETNPIVIWKRRAAEAQGLSEAGEYEASSTALLAILAEIETATGSAVENLRPALLGRLGFNALHQNDCKAALDFTTRAYEAARAAEDREAMASYCENLQSLRLIAAIEHDPERGNRVLELRRIVVRAQDAADAGRYRASLDALDAALEMSSTGDGDPLVEALLPKIFGLRGFNHLKLGQAEQASRHTTSALEHARGLGDSEGVRIYSANLEALDREAGGGPGDRGRP
jgi:tetratricopeptide (TPR) repeat protein